VPLNKPSDFFEQKRNEEVLNNENTEVETQKKILSPSDLLDEKEEIIVEENIEEEVVVDNVENENYQRIVELGKLVEEVRKEVSNFPEVIDYSKNINQLSVELERLRKAFGESEVERLRFKLPEFPEIPEVKYYDEDIKLLHKLVADIKQKQEIVSLSEGLLDEPHPDENKNFATLEDLSNHYRLFINRIQQQLATLGGGGETRFAYLDDVDFDTSNSEQYDGRYLKYNKASDKIIFGGEESWVDGIDGPYTMSKVGIGTTSIRYSPYYTGADNPNDVAQHDLALLVIGDARITGILTVGEASITLDANSGRITSGQTELVNSDGGASFGGTVNVGRLNAGNAAAGIIGFACTSIGVGEITSPPKLIIDPVGVGNSGEVIIKGNLIVEGTETKIQTQVLEISDKNIGIAFTSGTKLNDQQLDGAGIIIHGSDSNKSLTWDNSNSRLAFSTDIYAPKYHGDGSNLTGVSTNAVWETTNSGINTLSKVGIGTTNPQTSLQIGDTYGVVSGMGTFNAGYGSTVIMDQIEYSGNDAFDFQTLDYTIHFQSPNNNKEVQKILVMRGSTHTDLYQSSYSIISDSVTGNKKFDIQCDWNLDYGNTQLTVVPTTDLSESEIGLTTYRFYRNSLR